LEKTMHIARIVLTIVGALIALIGLVWIGQGTGMFPYPASSFMINQTPWILRGTVVTVIGVAIVWAARRLLR
jgi:hypothetical protein